MPFIHCLLYSLIFGIWRRLLGWEQSPIRRSMLVVAMFLLLLPLAKHGWPAYVVASGLSALMWTMGHRYDRWTVIFRYPVIGAWYPICKKWWRDAWNCGTFMDGWSAAGEILVGASYGAIVGWWICL